MNQEDRDYMELAGKFLLWMVIGLAVLGATVAILK